MGNAPDSSRSNAGGHADQAAMELPVNIRSDLIPVLRGLVLHTDECAASHAALVTQIAPVEAAAGRLTAKIADLDQEAEQIADTRLPVDAERVAAIIAGDEVGQLDKKEIEARALRGRHIAAQRRQLAEDLAAVQEHLRDLTARVEAAAARAHDAEVASLQALGEGLFEAYQQDAVAFVARNLPQLCSVSSRLMQKTGKPAAWVGWFHHDLKIAWGDAVEFLPAAPNTAARPKPVHVWPRPDGALLSGEPLISEPLLDGIVAALRASKS